MKYLLTLLVIVLFFSSCDPYKRMPKSKDIPNPYEFTLIDSVGGTQPELYVKASTWMAKIFTSAKEVIQMQDKEAGRIIGKGIIETPILNMYGVNVGSDYVHYTIEIDVKDGKYRCVLSDFYHEGGRDMNAHVDRMSLGSLNQEKILHHDYAGNMWPYIRTKCMKESKEMLSSLKLAMHTNSDKF